MPNVSAARGEIRPEGIGRVAVRAMRRSMSRSYQWFTTSPPPTVNFERVPLIRSVEPMKDIRRQVEQQTGVSQQFRSGEPLLRR